MAELEHVNFTVADPHKTATWMKDAFEWQIRWEGPSADGAGYMVHVGSAASYVSLYRGHGPDIVSNRFSKTGGLNHVAVVVKDFDATLTRIQQFFEPTAVLDYEPGRRFYFFDDNEIEYEVVCYD